MKNWMGLFLIAGMVVSCAESGEEKNNASAGQLGDTVAQSVPVQYLPVVAAAFVGVLPCADCDGVQTKVTLFADTTYEMTFNYLGKNPQDTAGLDKGNMGKFMMHYDTVHFENYTSKFIRNDTALIQVDVDGKPVPGSMVNKYILKKVQ